MFLTALAPEARVKGSRDPLGLLPIWSRLGRRLIGNVTTVSGDLRGWTSLLVSVGLVREFALAEPENPFDRMAFFRAEQLIGYARVWAEEFGPGLPTRCHETRGVSRVRMRLREARDGKDAIPLGLDSAARILGNQAAAGVWGQLSACAEASGLLDRRRKQLVGPGASLWSDLFSTALVEHGRSLAPLLRGERGFAPGGRHQDVAMTLAELHRPELSPLEVDVYRDAILLGTNSGPPVQSSLVRQWRALGLVRHPVGRLPDVALLASELRRTGAGEPADLLDDVVAAEHLLGPAELLFGWLLGQHGEPLSAVVDDLSRQWPAPVEVAGHATDTLLRPVVLDAYHTATAFDLIVALRDALETGAWRDAVRSALELNTWIMRRRGGAPWVTIDEDRIEVRLGDGSDGLPDPGRRDEVRVHSYYLDPLYRLIRAWEEGSGVP